MTVVIDDILKPLQHVDKTPIFFIKYSLFGGYCYAGDMSISRWDSILLYP
jgi:hypothetical protein